MAQTRLDLCLDFSNTVDWRNGRNKQDKLGSFADLVAWAKSEGVLTGVQASVLQKSGTLGKSESTFKRAIQLREATYRIFSSVARGASPGEADLKTLNSFLSASMEKSGIEARDGTFGWSWQGGEDSPERILWPIAKSAADLLTSEKLGIVRECSNEHDGCAWLFLDNTKNHTKKWCSMDTCGNRTKFRTYYERHGPEQEA
jgi:predicted RNA-binding Zn ribbon-like protein